MRSRSAAAILEGAGFSQAVSMEGGIKAWQGSVAEGSPKTGMAFFSSAEKPQDLAALAWLLEEGTRTFYERLIPSIGDRDAAELLGQLGRAEEHHKSMLAEFYREFAGAEFVPPSQTAKEVVMEGGLSIEKALSWSEGKKIADILDLLMSLETNAYDLYIRMQRSLSDERGKKVFEVLSKEEHHHLERLGAMLEKRV
jgi:rubrerythrin